MRGIPGRLDRSKGFTSIAAALLVGLASLARPAAQQRTYRPAEIDEGANVYAANCFSCHGDGQGVPGVDLRSGPIRRASTDDELQALILKGIPGTAMAAHALTTPQLNALVAYIRTMKDYGAKPVALGDPARGKTLFEGEAGCRSCHRVEGKGSRVALDLSNVGAVRPPAYLQRALLDPNSTYAETPEHRFVRAVTSKGATVTGRRVNEDTFTILVIDDHENLVPLDRASLRSYTILKESPMPSVKGKLTDSQVSDLVAYLASLKRAPNIGGAEAPAGRGGRGGPGGRGAAPPAPEGGRGGRGAQASDAPAVAPTPTTSPSPATTPRDH
jgi:putative heme-binding domain-containing protein